MTNQQQTFKRFAHSAGFYGSTGHCKYCSRKLGLFKRFLFLHVIKAGDVICSEHDERITEEECVEAL